jgi:hypothetical protein
LRAMLQIVFQRSRTFSPGAFCGLPLPTSILKNWSSTFPDGVLSV